MTPYKSKPESKSSILKLFFTGLISDFLDFIDSCSFTERNDYLEGLDAVYGLYEPNFYFVYEFSEDYFAL